MVYRALRNYRSMAPGPFHGFNQKVYKSLKDTEKFPQSVVAANQELFQNYFTASEKHDAIYHEATYGHKLSIAERELLQAQLIDYLDEIVLLVETAALHNPDILLRSGFDLAKERRSSSRTKAAPAPVASTAEQQEKET